MGVTGIVGLVSVQWFLRADSSSVLCCFSHSIVLAPLFSVQDRAVSQYHYCFWAKV